MLQSDHNAIVLWKAFPRIVLVVYHTLVQTTVAVSQCYGHPHVLGISILKTLVIWASPVTLTQIAKVRWEGDVYITRVWGMGMLISLAITVTAEVNKEERGLEPTETEVNNQEWGLELSVPNPLGQPLQYVVRCVWTTCLSPRPLLFILRRIAFCVNTKSYSVFCGHSINQSPNLLNWQTVQEW